ncbi:MAG: hypothetical protein FWD81_03075 [Methanomassiliicoccaceae archaeon]|nr:hypothetical protein [Methanomassiliicoccaceae archaeon]
MTEARMVVDAGVCRFRTTIHAVGQDDMTVMLNITSDCPNVQRLAATLTVADAIDAMSSRMMDNALMIKCAEILPHPACPIPCALVKSCEVAADLGLKRNVTLMFE